MPLGGRTGGCRVGATKGNYFEVWATTLEDCADSCASFPQCVAFEFASFSGRRSYSRRGSDSPSPLHLPGLQECTDQDSDASSQTALIWSATLRMQAKACLKCSSFIEFMCRCRAQCQQACAGVLPQVHK
eukprot:3529739-Pleurochrysis_carterae.AAC.1